MKITIIFLILSIIFVSCFSSKNHDCLDLRRNNVLFSAEINFENIDFVNEVLIYHFDDSAKSLNSYYLTPIDSRTNRIVIDSTIIKLEVKTYKGDSYKFQFVNQEQTLWNIMRNGLMIYSNKNIRIYPKVQDMEFKSFH